MTPNEITRVQEYLRTAFSNNRIAMGLTGKPNAPIEVRIVDEFVGVLHRDEDEGEVSYTLMMSILEEDLPPVSPM